MEKRKIQKTGGASFSITLPKKWIELNNLKEHDLIVSFWNGSSLTIVPNKVIEDKILGKINLDNGKDRLKRELIAYYILGFDEIEILGNPIIKEKRLLARKVVETLTGFEIIEDSANKIIIRNILSIEKLSFQESVSKMFLMAYSMFYDAINSVCENDKELALDIAERDFDIDKLYFLILRKNRYSLQNRSYNDLSVSNIKSLYYEGIATQIERIADHAVKVAGIVTENGYSFPEKFKKSFKQTAEKILPLLKSAEYFVKNIDGDKAHETLDQSSQIYKSIAKFSLEVIKQDSPSANTLTDSLDRLFGYIKNMTELTIDQAIVEKNK